MNPIPVSASCILQILILLLAFVTLAADENYLLSCGASSDVAIKPSSFDGRIWHSDNNSTFSTNFGDTTSTTSTKGAATSLGTPFSSARSFHSTFTYTFSVSPGPKFIRLFFNPSDDSADAYLTVQTSTGHLLLYNFSAYLASSATPNQTFVRKEYYVHAPNSRLLVTFSPTPPSSYVFVNGIEVVSVPEKLYVGPSSPIYVAAPTNSPFDLPPNTALETAYRVNVGGADISPVDDAASLFRQWVIDDPYLSPFKGASGFDESHTQIVYKVQASKYSAPINVYRTFRSMGTYRNEFKLGVNVTWMFEVDVGFLYLVRLHWCEVTVDINASNYRVFDVYIDEQTAEEGADVFQWAGGYSPVYRDYVIYVDGSDDADAGGPPGILQIAMHPNTQSKHKYYDILLNGLEILKINRSDGSLNATNPSHPPPIFRSPHPPEKSDSHSIPVVIGVIVGSILLIALIFYLLICLREKWSKFSVDSSGNKSSKSKWFLNARNSGSKSHEGNSSLPTHLCRRFTLLEIRIATSDFNNSLILGHGGFGNVYKGTIDTVRGPTTVAIKRLNPLSRQGANEFKMEIELLSKLRHTNLVSLIGYCNDDGEMILVYEYMSHGILRDHLYPSNDSQTRLSWNERLHICLGAARGLYYLHTGTDRMVIHRDIKSTNILLDERWSAKVSDFGLSKLGPAGGELSHVSTEVKGSFGYMDPEYYRLQKLTKKSDVYSFGVVLFEVLCGRPVVNPSLPKEQVNLRIWATRNLMNGTLETIVDPTIMGQIAPDCLEKFVQVAERCVRDEGARRPSMADVIAGLELALQLQLESSTKLAAEVTGHAFGDNGNALVQEFEHVSIPSPTTDDSVRLIRSSSSTTCISTNNATSRLFSSTTLESYGDSNVVFSQIFKPEGR